MSAALPPALARPAAATSSVTRRARLVAATRDAITVLPPLVAASALAIAWLLARSAWGRDDVRDLDSAIALAIVATVPPAWLARIALSLVTSHATPGQRALGLHIEVTRAQAARTSLTMALRLALHPFGAVGWAWLAGVLVLASAFEAALLLAVVAVVVAVAGIVSLAIILVTPDGRALHDRIAGTRLVRS